MKMNENEKQVAKKNVSNYLISCLPDRRSVPEAAGIMGLRARSLSSSPLEISVF
jgi:hypothetical protein